MSSQGNITYPSSNVNLALIPDKWSTRIFSNIFVDYSTVHTTGKPSIRLEQTGTSGNKARECYGPVLTVKPGDHIVGKIWIKIDSLPAGYTYEDYAGARIGFDLRNLSPITGAYHCLESLEAPTYPDTTAGLKANYVQFGTVGWVQRTIDFVVPTTYYTKDLYTSATISSMQINQVTLWMQVWSPMYGNSIPANAWFADAELYLNPV
jgi:hypothetical protein